MNRERALAASSSEGIDIFLISHDIHGVFDLADRVTVMKNGQIVGAGRVQDMTKDEVLGMIILGKCPRRDSGSRDDGELVAAESKPYGPRTRTSLLGG